MTNSAVTIQGLDFRVTTVCDMVRGSTGTCRCVCTSPCRQLSKLDTNVLFLLFGDSQRRSLDFAFSLCDVRPFDICVHVPRVRCARPSRQKCTRELLIVCDTNQFPVRRVKNTLKKREKDDLFL